MFQKLALSGSCHWCTEAIFESLIGVAQVEQGWVGSVGQERAFTEGVVVTFDNEVIELETFIAVHLYTHSCTARHSMREKYRSAVYAFSEADLAASRAIIQKLQKDFEEPIITQVLRFGTFKSNRAEQLHYYFSDPGRPFCETYVNPKLRLLLKKFDAVIDHSKLKHLDNDRAIYK